MFQITWRDSEYVIAWSGGKSSHNHCIEISNELADSINLSDGAEVELTPIDGKKFEEAMSIMVEPTNSDSWEILNLNAEFLEQQLINQVAVIMKDSTLPLWINKSTHLRIHIMDVVPDRKYLSLVPGTEVIVTPKPRTILKPPNSVEIAKEETRSSHVKRRKQILRIQQFGTGEVSHLYTHSNDMLRLNWYDGMLVELLPIKTGKDKKKKCFLRVYSSSLVNKGHVIIHRDVAKLLRTYVCSRIKVYPRVHLESNAKRLIEDAFKQPEPLKEGEVEEEPYEIEEDIPLFCLDDVGGLDEEISKCTYHINSIFGLNRIKRMIGGHIGGAIQLVGQQGSGKTLMGEALTSFFMQDHNIRSYRAIVSCNQFIGVSMETIKDSISTAFSNAILCQPSIIFFDDLDSILPPTQSDQQTWQSLVHTNAILSEFLKWIDLIRGENHSIALILSSKSDTGIHTDISNSSIVSLQVKLGTPNQRKRIEILKRIFRRKGIRWSVSTSEGVKDKLDAPGDIESLDLADVSIRCEGYLGGDIEKLVDRAFHIASLDFMGNLGNEIHRKDINRSENELGSTPGDPDYPEELFPIGLEHIIAAQQDFVPSSLKGMHLQQSNVSWDDVGGLEEVKFTLKQTIEWPTKYSFLFKGVTMRQNSGIILHGPSGCGKTMLACAVAKECGLNFLSVKGPEMLNKYIGQSEQSVRDMFSKAQSAAPCVLFFDEFDAIAPRRGHDNTGVTDRVVNQFLTQLDGVETLEGVYVLAATSRLDLIDPALLRPGRLDKSIYIGVPNHKDRLSIIKAITRKLPMDDNIDLENISDCTEGYTGADLQALFYNAQLEAIHEILSNIETTVTDHVVPNYTLISMNDSENVSLTEAQRADIVKRFELMKSSFMEEVDTNIPNGHPKGPVITQDILKRCLLKFRPSKPIEHGPPDMRHKRVTHA